MDKPNFTKITSNHDITYHTRVSQTDKLNGKKNPSYKTNDKEIFVAR